MGMTIGLSAETALSGEPAGAGSLLLRVDSLPSLPRERGRVGRMSVREPLRKLERVETSPRPDTFEALSREQNRSQPGPTESEKAEHCATGNGHASSKCASAPVPQPASALGSYLDVMTVTVIY